MSLSNIINFLRFSWSLTNGRVAIGLFLTTLVSLTEGLSLVLLIPIVAVAAKQETASGLDIPLIGQQFYTPSIGLSGLLIIFIILITLQAFLSRYKNLYNQKVLHDAADKMRNNLFMKIGMAKWSAIRSRRTSDLNQVLTYDVERIVTAIRNAQTLLQNMVMFIVYMGIAALVSWKMAIFAAIVGGMLFSLLYPVRRKATAYGREMTHLFEAQNHTILEFISNLRLIKSFTFERQNSKVYSDYLAHFRKSVVDFLALSSMGTVIFQIGAAVSAALFVWLALRVYNMNLAQISILILIFVRLTPRFNIIQEAAQQFLTNVAASSNYKKTIDYFDERQESDPDIKLPTPILTKAIHVNQVSVIYEHAKRPALKEVNLKIDANKITALIGPSGSGKSTLADLLMGLTEPDEGEILIDAALLQTTSLRTWRASVGVVSQEATLLNDTVLANLKLGNPLATADECWDALNRARIGDFIRSLPDGLNTLAGDRGTRFSGGERQRLTLARALLRKPQLLILDEATSALDWENQRQIIEAVKALRGELTIVVIAHRSSLVTFADNIVALDEGQIIENGSYTSLRANPLSRLSLMIEGDSQE